MSFNKYNKGDVIKCLCYNQPALGCVTEEDIEKTKIRLIGKTMVVWKKSETGVCAYLFGDNPCSGKGDYWWLKYDEIEFDEEYYAEQDKRITLQQFKAAKMVVLETFPFSMYRYSGIALITVRTIRDVQTGDPVHDLTDTWCGQESWYCARESECTETSWQDHSRHNCLACEVQAVIE